MNTLAKYHQQYRRFFKLRFLRVDPRCAYCLCALNEATATIDHITPIAAGGREHKNNYVLACGSCNRAKGKRAPFEVGMKMKIDPRPWHRRWKFELPNAPPQQEHPRWVGSYTRVLDALEKSMRRQRRIDSAKAKGS